MKIIKMTVGKVFFFCINLLEFESTRCKLILERAHGIAYEGLSYN